MHEMVSVHVLINCDNGSEKEVINELKNFETITEVDEVKGAFDIVAKLESPNLQDLRDNVTDDIRRIKKVISTITLLNNDDY